MSTVPAQYISTVREKATDVSIYERVQARETSSEEEEKHKNTRGHEFSSASSKSISTSSEVRTGGQTRPEDVSKLFLVELEYFGGRTEPVRWRYEIFLNAYHLCGVKTSDTGVMILLIQSTFLKGPSLLYFMDIVTNKGATSEDAIKMLEARFLIDRAKRINDDIWI